MTHLGCNRDKHAIIETFQRSCNHKKTVFYIKVDCYHQNNVYGHKVFIQTLLIKHQCGDIPSGTHIL